MSPATRSQTLREATAASTDLPQHNLASPQHLNDVIQRRSTTVGKTSAGSTELSKTRYPDTPPRFVIDLSLPPEQRYLEVCAVFNQEVNGLTPLFDEVVGGMLYRVPLIWVHLVCRLLLRRVHDGDENRELKGISKATGVPMYLLVCFNVLLDLFMGCSSGGAAVKDEEKGGTKMLHFRTLDWGMPSLRKVVIQLDFKTSHDGPIVASSLTYAGYVGVLTGVRMHMSLSLNFRPNRNEKGHFWPDSKYYWHLLMVLLGHRRSISSELRRFLIPRRKKHFWPSGSRDAWETWTYEDIVKIVTHADEARVPLKSTACYLCFSNGVETTVVEKDYRTAIARASDNFVVVTNTDADRPDSTATQSSSGTQYSRDTYKTTGTDNSTAGTSNHEQKAPTGMEDLLSEAKDRQQCAEHNYYNLRAKKARRSMTADDMKQLVTEEEVISLVQSYPTTNEETHFACVMDPTEGNVKWCRRWVKPISAKWIRSHMSET